MPFIPDQESTPQSNEPNNELQSAQTTEPQAVPQSGFVADQEQPDSTSLKSYLEAPIIGGFHMFDALATTLLKAGSKVGVLPGLTPESVQSTYDVNSKQFNKSMEQHPLLTGAGALAGGILQAAPTMMIPGLQGAGVGSLAALGKLGANMASNTAQMGVLGAITTSEDQDPNQVLSPSNAATGALFGAGGTLAGAVIGNTIEGAGRLYQAQKAAPGMKIFSSDLSDNSVLGNAWKWTVNSALGKLPGWLGTQGGRETQTQQAQKLISDKLTKIAQDTSKSGPVRIMNILKNHTDELDQTEAQLWNKFIKIVPNEPVERSNSISILQGILDDPNQIQQLTTNKGGELAALRQGLQAKTPNQMKEFKQDIWNVINRLQTKDSKAGLTSGEESLLSTVKQLYGANIDDLRNAVDGINPEALHSYEAANQFTKNYRNTLGNLPQLQKALQDSQDEMGKVSDFVNWIKSPKTTSREVKNASKLLGQTGQEEIGGQIVQNAFQNAQTIKGGKSLFNIDKFLNEVNSIKNSPQSELAKPALETIQGYVDVLKHVAAGKTSSGGMPAHVVGGLGIAGGAAASALMNNPIGAGAILATPTVLSTIAKNSPLKNLIISTHKAMTSGNKDLNTYMLNQFQNNLIKAGIIYKLNNEGEIESSHQSDEDLQQKVKSGMKISLNDETPILPNQGPGFIHLPKVNPPKTSIRGATRLASNQSLFG